MTDTSASLSGDGSLAASRRALAAARRALGPVWAGATLEPVELLPGSPRRALVQRVSVTGGPPGAPATVIVKHHIGATAPEAWARETAALSVLEPTDAAVPSLLASGGDDTIAVMSDLGVGPSVADALLGADAAAARQAVFAWVDAVSDLHAATVRRGDAETAFARELEHRGRGGGLAIDSTRGELSRAAAHLPAQIQALGVECPADAMVGLRDIGDRLSEGDHALSPGDTCPDNNLQAGARLHLLDFEDAGVRHLAWDVAYLTVPWPTCWCSWALPGDVATAAVEHYRRRLAPVVPTIGTDEWLADLGSATVAWAWVSVHWFLDAAVTADGRLEGGEVVGPSGRALILHRLDFASSTGDGCLAALAGRLHEALGRRWGAVSLDVAPAFRR